MTAGVLLKVGLLAPLLCVLHEVATAHPVSRANIEHKCAVRSSELIRYLVDGRETDSSAVYKLDSADVRTVSVRCVNPVDLSTIPPGSDVPGVSALAIWTRAPLTRLESLLARVNEAQRVHFDTTRSYALTLDQLGVENIPDDVQLTLDAASGRWRAEAVIMRPTSPRCVVFDGQFGAPTAGTRGVVRCHE